MQTSLSDAEMMAMRDNASESVRKAALEHFIKERAKKEKEYIQSISAHPPGVPPCWLDAWTRITVRPVKRVKTKHIRGQEDESFENQLDTSFDHPENGYQQERSPPPEQEIGREQQSPAPQSAMPWYLSLIEARAVCSWVNQLSSFATTKCKHLARHAAALGWP
jgi:hypothetical protein